MDGDGDFCDHCGERNKKSWRDEVHETFEEKLKELYCSEQFWDVKIMVEGQEYKCHRLILSVHSEYFKTMFTSG